MDILKRLSQDGDLLCKEDLEYLKIQVDIGDYSKSYKSKCYDIIEYMLEKFKVHCGKITSEDVISQGIVPIVEVKDEITFQDILKSVETIRTKNSSLIDFKELLEKYAYIFTCENVVNNLDFFTKEEQVIILEKVDFSEDLLEQYIDVFDHESISKCQKISENFVMKHFNKLNMSSVLKNPKNEWVNNMSSKLKVFLKLKGVEL